VNVIAKTNGGSHGWDDTSPSATEYLEGKKELIENPTVDCGFILGSFPDMRAIFFANGPSFKKGFVNPWIKMIDQYQIFIKVLNIKGEKHQGNFTRVQDMFEPLKNSSSINGIFAYIFLLPMFLAILS